MVEGTGGSEKFSNFNKDPHRLVERTRWNFPNDIKEH